MSHLFVDAILTVHGTPVLLLMRSGMLVVFMSPLVVSVRPSVFAMWGHGCSSLYLAMVSLLNPSPSRSFL